MERKPEEKKGLIRKLKDGIEDQEAQIQILGTFVRLGVVVWSGFIITLNYVELPMVRKSGNSDITFVASVFTGALATFGLTTGNKDGKGKPVNCPMAKKRKNEQMATTLPTSITHGSESRTSDSSIYSGVDELNNDNTARYRRGYNDYNLRVSLEQVEWGQYNPYLRYIRRVSRFRFLVHSLDLV